MSENVQPVVVKAQRVKQGGREHLAASCPFCGFAVAVDPGEGKAEGGHVCRCGRHLKLVEAR